MLTDEEVLVIVKRNLERQFPKRCTCCGRTFPSFADFVLELHSMHVGDPMCVDAEVGDWNPRDDEGTLGLTNCACGTTLALGSKGLGVPTMARLLRWARARMKERGVTIGQVLADLRTWVHARVLEESTRLRGAGRHPEALRISVDNDRPVRQARSSSAPPPHPRSTLLRW